MKTEQRNWYIAVVCYPTSGRGAAACPMAWPHYSFSREEAINWALDEVMEVKPSADRKKAFKLLTSNDRVMVEGIVITLVHGDIPAPFGIKGRKKQWWDGIRVIKQEAQGARTR